ncbi:sensor histidine kinase [Arthrobacter sp. NA-172]|uniref:sensor histidine kinase n=1 Tax=Arthrobacter sp. NA-172 TaxID=3367524 RepID=UPI003754F6EC
MSAPAGGRFWDAAQIGHRTMLAVTAVVMLSLFSDIAGLFSGAVVPDQNLAIIRRGVIFWSSGAILLAWLRSTFAAAALVPALAVGLFSGGYLYPLVIMVGLLGVLAATATATFVRCAIAFSVLWLGMFCIIWPAHAPMLLVSVPALAISWAIGGTIRRHRQQRQSDEQRIVDLGLERQSAAENERKSIARDLHDVVAHEITLIAMQARAAEHAADPTVSSRALRVIGDASRGALRDLRAMLSVLHQDGTAPMGDLRNAVEGTNTAGALSLMDGAWRLAERLRSVGIKTSCELEDDGSFVLPQAVHTALFRVLQESITNVAKHAGSGARCRIVIAVTQRHVALTVRNSVSASPSVSHIYGTSRRGLIGMEERVKVFGGTFSAGLEAGSWVVRAQVRV